MALKVKNELLPHPTGILLPYIENWIRARQADPADRLGPRGTATGSRLRASYAMKCARQVGLQIIEYPEDEAIPFEVIVGFDVGHSYHEAFQKVAAEYMGAVAEVTGDYHPEHDLSCHADLLYEQTLYKPGVPEAEWPTVKVVGEIKSMAGYGFLIAVGARKSDEGAGPKPQDICQAALAANAPNIDAQAVHMIYVDKDRHSIAEWLLQMDEPLEKLQGLTPRDLALAEIERMEGILGRLDANLLPARHIPGFGRVEHVPDPDSRDDPWNCRYCRYNATCASLASGPVPLDLLRRPEIEAPQ